MKKMEYIAHRGLFHNDRGIPENSMTAFRRAVEIGLPIELDVRLTRDQEIVVFHDAGCKRMTGVNCKVSDMPWIKLKALSLKGTSEHIPLFSEVLELVQGKVPLLIEVKNVFLVGCLERKLLKMLSHYKGEYMIESFHPGVVWWMKHHAPGVKVGQLVSMNSTSLNPLEKLIMDQQGFYNLTKPDFMAYDIRELTPAMAQGFRQKGIQVYGWTVRSVVEYTKMRNICDGVIFDTVAPEEIM